MYLPVILLDRYGWPGFVAFAVPNVLGCGAFGYAIGTAERSRRLVVQHGRAAPWFSSVTVAFHLFFAVFLVTVLLPGQEGGGATDLILRGGVAAAALYTLGWLVSWFDDRSWLVLAAAVYAVSLAVFFAVLPRTTGLADIVPARSPWELVWLLPVIAFGFLLCPYLDLTFHRALQRTPSRHAFAVFGASFTVMIVLTCFLWNSGPLRWFGLVHLGLQSVFTVGRTCGSCGRARPSPAPSAGPCSCSSPGRWGSEH